MAKVGTGFDQFVGTRASAVDPAQTEFFNKQTNEGFRNPGELATFVSGLGSSQPVSADNVFDVVSRGFTPAPINPEEPPASVSVPDLPIPQADKVQSSYVNSATADLESKRKAVEDAYQKELDRIQARAAESQKRIDELTAKEEATLEGPVQEALTPFREELEKSERERLKVEENFFANQGLVEELSKLLTQGNEAIKGAQEAGGPRGLMQRRESKVIADVAARAGVIEAVLSARNGQISQAYNLIDRSVTAVTADRQDQLTYYSALLEFYGSEKDTEGNRLLNLEKEERTFLNAQIGLLESDLQNAQATTNYIKELMIDPETAKFVADAGVTLNDSVEQVNKKMAEQTQRIERKEQQKLNRETALNAGVTTQFVNVGGEWQRTTDGYAFKSPEEFQEMTGMTLERAQARGMVTELSADLLVEREQVQSLMQAYPDAGIRPSDTLAIAETKLRRSPTYQKQVRIAAGDGVGSLGLGLTAKQEAELRADAADVLSQVQADQGTLEEGYAILRTKYGVNDEQLNTVFGISAAGSEEEDIPGSLPGESRTSMEIGREVREALPFLPEAFVEANPLARAGRALGDFASGFLGIGKKK